MVIFGLGESLPPPPVLSLDHQHFPSHATAVLLFIGYKNVVGKKSVKQGRWSKNVGLGFKTPKAAIEGSYIDKKCPFTGNVSIRGRILKGVVMSTKMKRTVVVRRCYLQYVRKYKR